MDANKHELILQEEVYGVVGCAIEVLNVRGHGLHEKIYENCLGVEFRLRGIPYTQQERHRVLYVGEYIPDLVVRENLIVDTKTIDRITDHERGQMHARLEWERLVLTRDRSNADERKSGEADFLLQPKLST